MKVGRRFELTKEAQPRTALSKMTREPEPDLDDDESKDESGNLIALRIDPVI